jgi:hypothetical protein
VIHPQTPNLHNSDEVVERIGERLGGPVGIQFSAVGGIVCPGDRSGNKIAMIVIYLQTAVAI